MCRKGRKCSTTHADAIAGIGLPSASLIIGIYDSNLRHGSAAVHPHHSRLPRPGILFRDITTLLGDAQALSITLTQLAAPWLTAGITHVAAIEARGFILGGALACRLGAGFVPLRKKGKLPHTTISVEYSLEYGLDELEMHADGTKAGDRVLLVDDLIATGGSAAAGIRLLRSLDATVVGAAFVIDLPELGGSARLQQAGIRTVSLVCFEGH